ncbi:PhzF family phenazine biosynthesis protein [Bacillus horti]|uniref:PhzF family phenazine biosynthesis protein n=2 Tax=Caldalkalibacillus horti TaxID=77523 RepID=A0ABT9VYU4_9BACI|nr:PhzF family phenazine biosynthesis protein [Bacillus horti]
MQEIARIVGLSETAFFVETDHADFKIRYFTPKGEVDICGHATVAAFNLLWTQERISLGTYTLLTKAGMLEVILQENGEVFLTQALPRYFEHVDRKLIADSLRISPDDLVHDLPVQIVSTGLRDILVPIKRSGILKHITPDFEQITKISRDYQVVGYHLFTLDIQPGALAECRNFAPLYGITEESATGTSNGALTCYLWKNRKLPEAQDHEYILKQGYTMNRPSEVRARLTINKVNGEITKVQVGGMATNIEIKKVNIN